ncbi:MAG TPA: DUF3105 domain-containing protein [Solirubrobacteraceae bacterium]|nr:DUF3105 domain-containing protein [Solirubrobacteraceae bacterium]
MPRLIERLLIVVAALGIAVGVIALLSGGLLAGHDSPGVSGAASGPGVAFPDQGNGRLKSGQAQPKYDSDPPTSGSHLQATINRNGAQITDDQLLQALSVGDVVLMYGTRTPPPGLGAVANAIAPAPFSPALAATGQAVVLAYRPGTTGVIGLAWAHMVHVRSPTDPTLRSFAQYWLGRGVPKRGGSLPSS